MKNVLLILGAIVAAGLGALVVVVLGVDLPDPEAPGGGNGNGSRSESGAMAGGDWDEDEVIRGLDAADPLDGSYDPLADFDAGPDEEVGGGQGVDGRGKGRRGDGTDGDGRRTGEGENGDPAPVPGEPDPGGRHLDELQTVLDSGDPEKLRMFLVSTTSVRGTELGVAEAALLLGALGDSKHAGLQQAILLHLERIGGEGVTEGLVGFLGERRPGPVVARTLAALGRINSPASISALVDAMATARLGRGGRQAAAEALARSRNPVAIGPLTATLSSSDRSTRQFAAATLVRVGTPAGYEAVLGLARAGDAPDRSLARRLLEKSARRPEAFGVMSTALARERDPALRVSLARSLGRSRNANAVRPLTSAAQRDQSPAVRAEAVMALGRVGGASAYGEVQRIAQEDPHRTVKRAAQRAMKQIERQRR